MSTLMENELDNSLATLKQGKILLYPTDTVWGIGCDATDPSAVKKIYDLKKRDDSKALICMVSDLDMLEDYVEKVPEIARKILNTTQKPTTIIYENPINVAENLLAEDGSLAIRIVKDDFCRKLIEKLNHPLVSTSANISNEKTPESFKEISPSITENVDYIVNLRRKQKCVAPSAIIKITNDGKVSKIRK